MAVKKMLQPCQMMDPQRGMFEPTSREDLPIALQGTHAYTRANGPNPGSREKLSFLSS